MPTARIAPSDFLSSLINPGVAISGMSGHVALQSYLCVNPSNGGNARAAQLQLALRSIVQGTPDESVLTRMGNWQFNRVFTGQGKPDHIREVMQLVWDNRAALQAYTNHSRPVFAAYFAEANPLQAMVNNHLFGLDCLGFVGRYLEAAGVLQQYRTWEIRHYADHFLPIRSITELESLCVLIWVDGSHIAIIDSVDEINLRSRPAEARISIGQSSVGAVHGPQLNSYARLRLTDSDFLDFGAYGRAVDGHEVPQAQREQLRASLTSRGATTGYRGGVFFNLELGTPPVPVRRHVYVGKLPNLRRAWDQHATSNDGRASTTAAR